MIEIHHLNNSRSQRIVWLAEELGVPYKVVVHMRDSVTMLAPASLTDIHPLGKSPIIVDGALVLPESGAIVEYLTETYGKGQLVPPRGTPDHVRYLYWLHYAEGSLMTPALLTLYAGRMGAAAGPLGARAQGQRSLHLGYLETELKHAPYFVGDTFTAVDVLMSFPLEFLRSLAPNESYPAIDAYLARLHARPAYKKALETGEAPYDLSGYRPPAKK